MDIRADGYSGDSGWYCPGCESYHGPHVATCPYSPYYLPTPYMPTVPWPYYPNGDKEKRHCPKCGIELSDVMMYVCMNPGCPTGLGGTVMLNEDTKDEK